jgi:hypothetical protein
VATTSTVADFAAGQAVDELIIDLLSDPLPEAITTGQKLLKETQKVAPALVERADKPEQGGAQIAYQANTFSMVKQLTQKYIEERYSNRADTVQLLEAWPRNELDLTANMLYEHSNLPLKEIQKVVSSWPYERKEEVFNAYIGKRFNRQHIPGRAFMRAQYSWDLVSDYSIFCELQSLGLADSAICQDLSPHYGFEVPELIENAGLTEQFEACFDLSLQLYSHLQGAGYPLEAQYATLMGHKVRWQASYHGRQAFQIHEHCTTGNASLGCRELVQEMHEKLAEIHPLTAEAMKFVGQAESKEQTRQAAETYTQFKLNQLK